MSLIVKPIKKEDIPSVRFIDNHGEFDVLPLIKDTLENNEKQYDVYGAFVNNILVGYCSICGAETLEFEHEIPVEFEDQLLGDIFILEPFRHMGYGTNMVTALLELYKNHDIFVVLTNNTTKDYYQKFGFETVKDNVIVKRKSVS